MGPGQIRHASHPRRCVLLRENPHSRRNDHSVVDTGSEQDEIARRSNLTACRSNLTARGSYLTSRLSQATADKTKAIMIVGGHSASEVVPRRKLTNSYTRTMVLYNIRLIHRLPN